MHKGEGQVQAEVSLGIKYLKSSHYNCLSGDCLPGFKVLNMFDIGRVCLKIAGREAGKYCVVVNKIDDNFVLVTGPRSVTKVKRRKCNITHLEPLKEMVKIKADASDHEVIEAYQEASLFSKLDLHKPEHGERQEKEHAEKAEHKEKEPEKPKKAKKKKESE
jgi:large subunit ribosomal protein L14e